MSSSVLVDRADLVEVYRALEVVVVSLARFGSWSADQDPAHAGVALTKMHDDIDVFRRLSNARQVLASYFDDTPGDDDMDELEREMRDESGYWNSPS
jgi:hypothetical protein